MKHTKSKNLTNGDNILDVRIWMNNPRAEWYHMIPSILETVRQRTFA